MEADGIVERRSDPDDGRGTLVAFTRAGRSLFRRAHQVYEVALGEHLGRSVSASDAKALTRALEAVAARRPPAPDA
jgi:DNA-binding MarR family transcriptional regulator